MNTENSDPNTPFEIWLAGPRGFCAGVDRAISIVESCLEKFGTPLYVKHQIVHNPHVVRRLEEKGAIFVEEIQDIPEGANAIFSAHGVSPQVRAEAEKRNLFTIDATCPLVRKVHKEAERFAGLDYQIILIGHKNHVEVEGTYGHAPDRMHIVGSVEDVKTLELPKDTPISYITQTTLSLDDTKEIIEALFQKFPQIKAPPKQDICYATTNRQNAVKELAGKVDLMLVVGAPNSSNTVRLVEVAELIGTRAVRIQSLKELEWEWLESVKKVGITAGASAPEDIVQEIVNAIKEKKQGEVFELKIAEETTYFPLPYILRKDTPREENG